MKRILFDLYSAQPAGSSKYHGGGEYIKTVLKFLLEDSKLDFNLAVYYNKDKFIDSWVLDLLDKYGVPRFSIDNPKDIRGLLEQEKFDIFYSGLPYYLQKEFFCKNIIVRGTIHGLRAIELPVDEFTYKYEEGFNKIKPWIKYVFNKMQILDLRKRAIANSKSYIDALDEYICDSVYTKWSLVESYPNMKNKIVDVLYAPLKYNPLSKNRIDQVRKYILLIGGNRWEKNSLRAVRAIDELFTKNLLPDYDIVVVGIPFKGIQKALKNSEKFTFKDYLEPQDLEDLYAYCDIFLYPTLNEGFGLPPIEAMKYGKTCIVSAVCSLPELYGDSVYWINPYDEYEIQNRILMAIKTKIDEEKINKKMQEIMRRQKIDLQKICEFIVK